MSNSLLALIVVTSCLAAQDTRVSLVSAPPGYRLGPGDQFSVEIADLEELNGKVHRVDYDGTVTLPLVGRVQAAGLTLPEFEKELDEKLGTQLRDPHIAITVTDTLSQPVTVLGAVNTPGIHQMHGSQTLAEALSAAGGLKNDASYRVTITRQIKAGDLPLSDAHRDDAHGVITGEVDVNQILNATDPAANILLLPHDVITVPRAKLVYVFGEVKKAGGFTLEQRQSMSVVEALALAEGTTPNAAKNHGVILRKTEGKAERTEVKVDLNKIIAGKESDITLHPDDILFVPNSVAKVIRTRAIETAIATASGILIWRGL
jgi:polysaccharide export outer membrane protein